MDDQWQGDRQVRVLVAHADGATREQIRSSLAGESYTLQEVISARELLASLDATRPDLLLLDPNLPAADLPAPDAPGVLAYLQQLPLRATMAILALASAQQATALLAQGADQVLPSPLLPHSLRLAVQALLRLKFAERAARELLARRVRDQQTLQRACQRLAACHSLQDTLTTLAEVVRSLLGYDRASVALYDPATAALRNYVTTDRHGHLRATNDLSPISLAPGSPLRDLPAYQALFEQGQDLFYLPDSAGRAPAYFRPYLDGPVRETLLVALRTPQAPVGLLTVDNLLSGRRFGPEDGGLLVTLAGQAALAIERARLAETLAARAREAEAVAQVGAALAGTLDPATLYHRILDQITCVLPADHASILSYEDHWAIVEACWGEPRVDPGTRLFPLHGRQRPWLPGADGTPVYLRDTADEPAWQDIEPWTGTHRLRSLIVAPLVVDGVVLGASMIGSFEPDSYLDHHVRLVATFAERINLALRNARLYAAEQERARAAEELARMRNDFVSSVSHELRTPLTAIIGFAEILQARWTQTEDEERLAWVGKIVNAANRQQRLVEDLLLLSRMETGNLAPQIARVALRSLCQRAAEEVQGSYPGQRIDLVGPDRVVVLADPERSIQVLANLVDNAAKYSPEGSPIVIWWGVEEQVGVVRVLDRGPGITSQGRNHLFTRFGRVPGSRMRAGRVGTGLGLFLGRGLARAMAGDVELESTGPDGSTFLMRLPLAPGEGSSGEADVAQRAGIPSSNGSEAVLPRR